MDFHSLTRKELQTLCKKNKIPANITNIAMAEALTALENVVGLEEFINQFQSPEKMALESESPSINLRSASTRRKPISADPETAEPMTRTRRTTRKAKIDQENKKNLMEIPLVQTNRRRQPSGSVQRTRQSVRLLEKCLSELCLKEKGSEKPVKMMDVSVANCEKTNGTRVSSLENKEEMKDVQQQDNQSDDQEVKTQNSDDLHNHVSELIAKEDAVHDEIEFVSASNAEFLSETGNASEEVIEAEHCLTDKVYEENSEAGYASEEVMEPENCLACKVSDESPSNTKVDEDLGCQLDSTATDSCVEKEMMILEKVVALNNPKVATEEQLIDVGSIEAKVPISNEDKTPEFVKQISYSYKENIPLSNLAVDSITEGNPGSDLVDVHVMQAEALRNQMNDGDSFSSSKLACRNSMSPLEADPLPIQFPRHTPTKSSGKKQPTNEKLIILAAVDKGNTDSTEMKMESDSKENTDNTEMNVESDNKENTDSTEMKVESDNKENIDSSGIKVESKKDKLKKNKNIVDKYMMLKSLEDKSLRELNKMLKQKLQIKIDQNIVKQQQVGNTRAALQSLAENLKFAGEPKNEI